MQSSLLDLRSLVRIWGDEGLSFERNDRVYVEGLFS